MLKRLDSVNGSCDDFFHYYQGEPREILDEITSAGFKVLKNEVLLREGDGSCDFLVVHATKSVD